MYLAPESQRCRKMAERRLQDVAESRDQIFSRALIFCANCNFDEGSNDSME